jgi:hypothetical protein
MSTAAPLDDPTGQHSTPSPARRADASATHSLAIASSVAPPGSAASASAALADRCAVQARTRSAGATCAFSPGGQPEQGAGARRQRGSRGCFSRRSDSYHCGGRQVAGRRAPRREVRGRRRRHQPRHHHIWDRLGCSLRWRRLTQLLGWH